MVQYDVRSSGFWRAAVALLVAVCALGILPGPAHAQKVFASPEEAMKTLVETVRAEDLQGVLAILGPDAGAIISSGDEVADKAERERFVRNCQEKLDLVQDRDRVSVIIGNDNIPFAIPIVKRGDGWVFDTQAGKQEILNRRIGRNELNTIQVCLAYVEAQQEYASSDRQMDGIIQYAQKLISDPGKRNGLYWEAGEGEVESPLGPLMAKAATQGYKRKADKPAPYYGYYFKILKGQGTNAPGGRYSYVINGHMVAGFALVAWPAEYGVSGIMTFVADQNGIVYEKNLGAKTAEIARAMTVYDPDRTWRRAE